MKCDRTLSLLIVLHVRKCHFSFLKDDYFEFIEDMTEIYFGFLFSYIKNCHSLWINIIHETWTQHYTLSLFSTCYVRKCHFSFYLPNNQRFCSIEIRIYIFKVTVSNIGNDIKVTLSNIDLLLK